MTSSRTGSASKLFEEERRNPNNEPDNEGTTEEPGLVEEAQGSPEDPAADEPTEPTADEQTEATEAVPEEPMVEEEPTVSMAELEAVRKERDGYLDTLLRQKADFENARKRLDRERSRVLEAASEKLVRELLPVLDNLDRALESGGDIRGGVQATREQLADVLANEGLLPISSDGQPFDPNVHEAVMGQPSEEHEEGTIIQTFQKGYLLNGRAVRPAKVVVAKQA